MDSFLGFLTDPDAVAKFQALCGIVRVDANGGCVSKACPEDDPKSGSSDSHDYHAKDGDDSRNGIIHRPQNSGTTAKIIPSDNKLGSVHSDSASLQPNTESCTSNSNDSRIKSEHSDDYIIRNKVLYYLFQFGASLGNEIFYITFFPFWFWNIDGFVGRRLCIFWCVFMYLGQALKDVIKIPRPSSPPVVQMEKRYALEYGMPSTHAMVGTGIPFAMFFMTKERYNYPSELALIVAIAWSSLVCCSRIYLGMHTFLDVIMGVGIVSSLLFFCVPLLDVMDDFMLHSSYSPAACILVPFLLCLLYPTLHQWSTARGDTTVILATGAGVGLGHWVCYQYGYMQKAPSFPPYDIIPPTWSWAGLVVLRMAIGIVILVTIRAAVRTVTFRAACYLAGYDRNDSNVHKTLVVELPYKFVTYSVVAFNMVYLAPVVFRTFGIERETFFTEI